MTGAALFRPGQDAVGFPAGDRDTQAQGSQLAPVSGGVGTQVGRGQGGPIFVEDTQPAASSTDGAASVSVRVPYQRLGVPCAASQQGWSPPAALADLSQEPAALAFPAVTEGELACEQPCLQRRYGPAGGRQSIRGLLELPRGDLRLVFLA